MTSARVDARRATGDRPGMRACVVVSAMLIASAEPARAEVPPVRLDYTAPATCPDRAAFVAQVAARTPTARFDGAAPRRFVVTITATVDGFAGTLEVGDGEAERQLAARHCEDLAVALALVTALAIDPEGTQDPAPSPPRPSAPTRPHRAAAGVATRAPPAPRRGSRAVVVGALVEDGVAPAPVIAAELRLRTGWTSTALGAVALELALHGGRHTVDISGSRFGGEATAGTAGFTWLAARPGVCVERGRALRLTGCGHLEIGLVHAAGEQIVNGRAIERLWAAAGVHAGARWPARSRGFAELQLGVSVPWFRDRYLFNPGVTVHETPAITGWIGVGAGLHFR